MYVLYVCSIARISMYSIYVCTHKGMYVCVCTIGRSMYVHINVCMCVYDTIR